MSAFIKVKSLLWPTSKSFHSRMDNVSREMHDIKCELDTLLQSNASQKNNQNNEEAMEFYGNRIIVCGEKLDVTSDRFYYHNILFQFIGNDNTIVLDGLFDGNSKIEVLGSKNAINLGPDVHVTNLSIHIHGEGNRIEIEKSVYLFNICFWEEGNKNQITVGKDSTFGGGQLSAWEGSVIRIGEDCMFSWNVNLFTSDTHPITDKMGKRINFAKNIVIGNHVWVGANAVCLKGIIIPDNCVIGMCSVVTKAFNERCCSIAGNPAKIINREINWNRHL